MSEEMNQHNEGSEHNQHEAFVKTPKQLIVAVVAALVVPIICIVLLIQYVTNEKQIGAGSDASKPELVASRIAPVADAGFTFRDASEPKQLQAGEVVYKAVCAACHDSGAAGAPKLGDASGWSARIRQGYDTLVLHAVKGIRTMPAKGGNPDLDDVEVARAVVYMANKAGASFKEPEAPISAPASAAASASAASQK